MLLISFFSPPNSFFFVKQVWNTHISVFMSFSTLFWHLGYFPFTSLHFPIYFSLLTVEVAGSCWVQGRWCVALFLLAQGTFNSDSVWGFAERTVVHRKGHCFSYKCLCQKSAASLRLLRVPHPDWITWIVLAKRGENTWHFAMLDSNYQKKNPSQCFRMGLWSSAGRMQCCFSPLLNDNPRRYLLACGDTEFKPFSSWCQWVCEAGIEIPWPLAG